MDRFKITLQERQAELLDRLMRTHKHLKYKPTTSRNSHENQVETANDDVVLALELDGQVEMAMINKALNRIATGDYFKCTVCGGKIVEARLDAIPYTDLCASCAETLGSS